MSLINCEECGKEISDKADKCPNCGCPISKESEVVQENTSNYVKTDVKKSKWSTIKLVMGIISMFLFVIIAFQSCAAGLSNAIDGSKEASGSFGMIVAILITIAGIISVSTSKSIKKGGSIWCASLYYICALFSFIGAGRFGDLKLWGFICFCFGFVHLISILLNKKSKIIGCICSVLFILFLLVSGGASEKKPIDEVHSSNDIETNSNIAEAVNESEVETEKHEEEKKESDNEDLNNQVEIAEYSYETSLGDTMYYMVVKNNSSVTISIENNVTALDAEGNTIGASSDDENAIESGYEVCLTNYFDGNKDIPEFKYSINVKEDEYYEPILSDLKYDISKQDKKVIITCTNEGEEPAQFVEAIALFFADGKLIRSGSTYIVDDDSELKSGATLSKEIDCYDKYDDVKVYFSGRR